MTTKNRLPASPAKTTLTPKECAEQFRMYAGANTDKPDAVHQLNFCADFLDEFCSPAKTDAPKTPLNCGVKEAASESVKATGQNERLRMACELTLLFYTVGPWTNEKRDEWAEKITVLLGPSAERDAKIVGANGDGIWDGARPSNEATTKNLCNAIRAALAYEN